MVKIFEVLNTNEEVLEKFQDDINVWFRRKGFQIDQYKVKQSIDNLRIIITIWY